MLLTGKLHGDAVAHGQPLRRGEALLHQTAAHIRWVKRAARAHQRGVDVHRAVVCGDVHVDGHIVIAERGFKVGHKPGGDGINAVNGADFHQLRAVCAARQRDPEIGEIVCFKIGVDRRARHARHAVKRGEGERAERTQ